MKAHFATMKNATEPGMLVIAGDYETTGSTGGKSGRIAFTPKQRSQIRNTIRQRVQGSQNFGEPLILDRLISDVKPFRPNPSEMSFMEGHKLTRSAIMHGIGVSASIAGQVEDVNRSSIEEHHKIFLMRKVAPILNLFSQEFTKKIGGIYSDDLNKIVIWFEVPRVRDTDLMTSRFSHVLSHAPDVFTQGEVRRFISTGEYDPQPRDTDSLHLRPNQAVQTIESADAPSEEESPEERTEEVAEEKSASVFANPYTLEHLTGE